MSDWTPRDPDFEHVVRSSFARQGLMATYGAHLAAIAPGEVSIELGYRPELGQQHGLFHGGVTAAVTDSACGYAALTLMPAASEVVTVEFKINLLAPALGSRLLARGRVIRAGRTITVCRGEAYVVGEDGAETHCAELSATMMRLEVAAGA